jgi:hypothetical protein
MLAAAAMAAAALLTMEQPAQAGVVLVQPEVKKVRRITGARTRFALEGVKRRKRQSRDVSSAFTATTNTRPCVLVNYEKAGIMVCCTSHVA